MGCPEVDVWLSPGHRVLMQRQSCNLMFGQSEVLASARFLLGDQIRQSHGRSHVTYCHLMFDQHEIVQTYGLRSDVGFYGPTARRDLKQF